jgi:hypothetical protein
VTRLALCLAFATGCGGTSDRAEVGSISFEAPSRWERTDTRVAGSATAVFTPAANARKESITVIRAEVGPIATRYSVATLTQLLAGAQTALANVRTSPITRVGTDSGLEGLQVIVDYVPTGLGQPYRRIHAVLSDGTALVHVMYTALVPDPALSAFHRVISTLREES